jgi:hypothetical protein
MGKKVVAMIVNIATFGRRVRICYLGEVRVRPSLALQIAAAITPPVHRA